MNESRIARVLEAMRRHSLDQIIVTAPASVYYLTGRWTEPMERMLALYLNRDGQRLLFANTLFALEEQDGVELVLHTDSDDPVEGLSRAVRPGALGIDKTWQSKFLIRLCALRPDVRPVLGSAPVDETRMHKDAEEIEALRAASRINDEVVAEAIAAVSASRSELAMTDLTARAYLTRCGARSAEGQLACYGANAADPHHAPSADLPKPGDSIVLDLYNPAPLYWCDMTRTVFFQHAGEKQREVYELVRQANLAGIAAVRPGVPLREVDRAAREVIEKGGYGPYFTHRLGHGIGLECHESPDVSASSGAVAEPGMAFSIEPGIYLPGEFGVRIEDLVLVTETGCEVLNRYPKDLQVVG